MPNCVNLSDTLPSMPAALHLSEHPHVDVAGSLRLRQRGDVLAQVIEGQRDAFALDFAPDRKRFPQGFTGYESAREPPGDARGLYPPSQAALPGEEQQQGAHPST